MKLFFEGLILGIVLAAMAIYNFVRFKGIGKNKNYELDKGMNQSTDDIEK